MEDLQRAAIRDLGISFMELCDRTLYELSVELEGHGGRWEESWRHTRLLGTLLFNPHVPQEDRVRVFEFMPLPSDAALIAFNEFIESLKAPHMMEDLWQTK